MDLSKMDEHQKYLEMEKLMGENELTVSGMRRQDEFMTVKPGKLKKDTMKVGQITKKIFPKELVFDFNPADPDDNQFSSKRKFHMPWSVTTDIIFLKKKMSQNTALHALYSKYGDMTPEEYKLEPLTEVTDLDRKVFRQFVRIYFQTVPIYKYKFSAWKPYGRKGACLAKFDELDRCEVADASYELMQLELALISAEVKEINDSYKVGGANYGKPDDNRKKEVSAKWKEMRISNPYDTSATRRIVFPLTEEKTIDVKAEDLKKFKMQSYEKYGSADQDLIQKLNNVINKFPKYDLFDDFLEVDVTYPDLPCNEDEKLVKAWTGKEIDYKVEHRVTEYVPDFVESYRAYRDNTDIWNDKNIKKSVWEFNELKDDVIFAAYAKDLSTRKNLLTKEIVEIHGDLIARINEQLSEELMASVMLGSLPSKELEVYDMEQIAGGAHEDGINEMVDEEALAEVHHFDDEEGSDDTGLSAEELLAQAVGNV